MASIQPIKFVGLLLVVAGIVLATNASAAKPAGDGAGADATSAEISRRVYYLADLPVYRVGPNKTEFDPSVLIALVKKSIDPGNWRADSIYSTYEFPGRIQVFSANLSMVVLQSKANHAKLALFLNTFRKK